MRSENSDILRGNALIPHVGALHQSRRLIAEMTDDKPIRSPIRF